MFIIYNANEQTLIVVRAKTSLDLLDVTDSSYFLANYRSNSSVGYRGTAQKECMWEVEQTRSSCP